jgi:DAK2 domain fusion protein YloV
MLQELDSMAVRRWAAATVDQLSAHRAEIDRINVFPVADADTGTNLLLTMRAAVDELRNGSGCPGRSGGPLDSLARGALLGGRGNSGLVLGQFLRGLAQSCPDGGALDAARLSEGLRFGAELARLAFAEPVDGTALTVLAAAADAVRTAGTDKLAAVADAAVAGAAAALADTPSLLPALARAGVVDAGGSGVLVVLEALAAVVADREPSQAPEMAAAVTARAPREAASLVSRVAPQHAGPHEYEVMYLLDGSTDERVATLRAVLAGLGDSVAVVGDGGVWNVHVHCTDVGAAIEAGVEAGRPHRITVLRFADAGTTRTTTAAVPRLTRQRAVVAVVPGAGMAELFRGEGVAVVVPPESGAPAAVAELLDSIAGTGARHVVVLPNAADGTAVAEAAAQRARAAGQDVVVVPTASPAQGLAALAVHDPARRACDDVVAMAEAAAATRCGELTIATGEALTWAGRCQPGDVLGLVDGEVVLIESNPADACRALVGRMLSAGGELVTALLGADAPNDLAEVLEHDLRWTHPGVELVVYHGGQPGPLLVGVE